MSCYFIIIWYKQSPASWYSNATASAMNFYARNQIKSADGLHTTQQTGTCFLLIVTINCRCRDVKQLTADARIRKFGGDLHTALKRKIIILLKELRYARFVVVFIVHSILVCWYFPDHLLLWLLLWSQQ